MATELTAALQPAGVPPAPTSLEAVGVNFTFLQNLAIKWIYQCGEVTGEQVANNMRLPFFNIVEKVLTQFVKDQLCDVTQGTTYMATSWKYVLTKKGMERAEDAISRNSYTGPCPISLSYYTQLANFQSPYLRQTLKPEIEAALADMMISPAFAMKLGPAVNSRRALFLYGPPGNGKTSVAERVRRMYGGTLWVPYALEVDNEVINILDPTIHEKLDLSEAQANAFGSYDKRLELCKRPLVVVGGELTMGHLELSFEPTAKFYRAPIQVKANGGVLLIDDFGRQRCEPRELLNRWIVPLEKRVDYLSLHTGKQFCVPFEQLVIFATNLQPRELVDEAFLRRIGHKIRISDPSLDEFREVFKRCCASFKVQYDESVFMGLVQKHYTAPKRAMRFCHPRDIVELIADRAKYLGVPAALTPAEVDFAVNTYFVEL